MEGGGLDANGNSIFKRYSAGELGNFEAPSSSATKKRVRFFGTVRVTLVARSEELLPFARLIWYNQEDYRNFKRKYEIKTIDLDASVKVPFIATLNFFFFNIESAMSDIEKLNGNNPFKDSMSALFDAYVEAKEFETYYSTVKRQLDQKNTSTVTVEENMHLSFDDLNIDSHGAFESNLGIETSCCGGRDSKSKSS